VIAPNTRAKVLDAEMQLQRAWLELSLREFSHEARKSPWAGLNAFNVGKIGLSLLKHRSMWLMGLSLMLKFFRRNSHKEK